MAQKKESLSEHHHSFYMLGIVALVAVVGIGALLFTFNSAGAALRTLSAPEMESDALESQYPVRTCSDSDGGLIYEVPGRTVDKNGAHIDTCSADGLTLKEWYCKDPTEANVVAKVTGTTLYAAYKNFNCASFGPTYGCAVDGTGKGYCDVVIQNSCYDSDPGNDLFYYGYINFTNGTNTTFSYDTCWGTTAYQWACGGSGSYIYQVTGNCPYGCDALNRVCESAPQGSCFDSDPGNDAYMYGFVNGTNQTGQYYYYGDFCNGNQVGQYYCNGNHASFFGYASCAYGCSNGECQNANVTALPDLVVLGATYATFNDTNGTAGGNILITVKNIGNAPSTTFSYVFSQLNVSNGSTYSQNVYVPALSNLPGQNTYVAYHGIYVDLPYGYQTYTATVDYTNKVQESNEYNNWYYTQLWTYP